MSLTLLAVAGFFSLFLHTWTDKCTLICLLWDPYLTWLSGQEKGHRNLANVNANGFVFSTCLLY